jgi:Sulfate permease family
VRRYAPSGGSPQRDAVAGLTGAIGSVPDGTAPGVLAGVNPDYGLYASLVGPVAGGLFTSTQLLRLTTTSAAAIAVGESIAGLDDRVRDQLFRSGRVNACGPPDVYPGTRIIGEARRRAVAGAEAWLVARRTPPPGG